MKHLFTILSFLLWLVTVPLSLFPLFKMRTSFELDLLITTIERGSEWKEITYITSVQDLWASNNQLLAILLIILVMVLPGVKYVVELCKLVEYKLPIDFNIDGIKKLVFTDIFLVSLLLIISYQIESLIIEATIGLYLLIVSVTVGYVASYINR